MGEIPFLRAFYAPVILEQLRWSGDGRWLLIIGSDGKARLFGMASQHEIVIEIVSSLHHREVRATCGAWFPHSTAFAIGDSAGFVATWLLNGSSLQPEVLYQASYPAGSTGPVMDIAWPPGGGACAVLTASALEIVAWPGQETDRNELVPTSGPWGGARALSWSPDTRRICVACVDGWVRVLDAQTGEEEQSSSEEALQVSWSPDGRWVCVLTTDRLVSLWRVADGLHFAGSASLRGVRDVAWSPDNSHLAFAGNNSVRVYRIGDEGFVHRVVSYPARDTCSVAWSAQGVLAYNEAEKLHAVAW